MLWHSCKPSPIGHTQRSCADPAGQLPLTQSEGHLSAASAALFNFYQNTHLLITANPATPILIGHAGQSSAGPAARLPLLSYPHHLRDCLPRAADKCLPADTGHNTRLPITDNPAGLLLLHPLVRHALSHHYRLTIAPPDSGCHSGPPMRSNRANILFFWGTLMAGKSMGRTFPRCCFHAEQSVHSNLEGP